MLTDLNCRNVAGVTRRREGHRYDLGRGDEVDLRMPLARPVGPSQQVQLTGQGSWRTGKFKSCDDVAAASSIRDQHPKGGVSP